jgi:hypothetical protein
VIESLFGFRRRVWVMAFAVALTACTPAVHIIEVTSPAESGPGSLRDAIERANDAEEPVRIVSGLPGAASVGITRELPALSGDEIEIDARGLKLVGGSCVRSDGRRGCSGLVVTGSGIAIRNLDVGGFLFDGISVRSDSANDVVISESYLHGNQDDGIGVSNGAQGIRITDCLIEGNGFRTKGKGVLVFDSATATLKDNVIRGNRDGVTISKNAQADLIGNLILRNYDKGLGVSGASLSGRGNEIRGNGLPDPARPAVPNGDGLRVGLTSSVRLVATRIVGNGDAAVVVMNDSVVELSDATLAGNGGPAVQASGDAVVRLIDVTWRDNAAPQLRTHGEARIEREAR